MGVDFYRVSFSISCASVAQLVRACPWYKDFLTKNL